MHALLTAALVAAIVTPDTQSLRAAAKNGSEHGWLLRYEPHGKQVKVSDFDVASLDLTAKRDANGEDAQVRAEFAQDGHVWRVELNRPPTPPSPHIATIEMREGQEVRTANRVKDQKTIRNPAVEEPAALVSGEQQVFGFAGTRGAELPAAKAQLVIHGPARVWRDGRLVAGSVPMEVAILQQGIVHPERGGAMVGAPTPQSGPEVHVIVDDLPVRLMPASRLHAVFQSPDVTMASGQ